MSDKREVPTLPDSPRAGGWWRHRKGGVYQVVCVAYIEATMTPAVVYRSAGGGLCWVRPVAEFLDGRFVPTVEHRPFTLPGGE
jgi:hypothetical protein